MPYSNSIVRGDVDGLIPLEYSNEFLDLVAESSHILRMARRLRNMARYQQNMPVLSALATAYFVSGETGLKQTTEINWEDVTVTAEELAVIVPIAQATLDDANIDIWAEVRKELVTALGVAIDNAMLYGTNKPSTWPDDIVTDATAAGNVVEFGTGADLYEDIMSENGTLTLIEQDGFLPNGHIGELSLKGLLRGLRDADGQPIFVTDMRQASSPYSLDGVPINFPTNGVASASYPLISGDWSQLAYSMRQDMTWKIATEAVIQDAQGDVVYNLFQQDMVALRVVMRLGMALPNPINRVNTTAATRYPFAVLTDLV
jgi:HK97 family phage major capsid protein